jgi:hypothetical protein
MANKHYEHALEGLPCRVSTTAHIIYQIICYRFDDRITLTNGKPNPGYNKSYPGMNAFVKATGRSRQACNTAIESLIAQGLVARITIGKPGSRAEYVPIHTVSALGISVKNTLHVSKQYKSRKLADNVKTTNSMSKEDLPKETSSLNTISTISNHKYDKLITLLPIEISQYVKPGKNIDKLLDRLVNQGVSIEAVCAYLSRKKYSDRWTIGGTVVTHLEALLGDKRPISNKFKSTWCGKCDDGTRQFVEASPGIDGKNTYECPTCHPNQIRIKERMDLDPFKLEDSLVKLGYGDTFKLPD